ncbi:MAG: hypothetical protein JEZ07_16010 [Phycisphaerae bacterium]|nr:hypothetical protein [Phycisphaerae bacterium]
MKMMMNNMSLKTPSLRFTPYAWAKLIFMRDITVNEVGSFGITDLDDLLLVKDIAIIKQRVSPVTVAFDDNAVADFFEDQVEANNKPEQFARIWLHTHPGSSPEPSGTDEQTFHRVFGSCDWSIMAIIAQDGNTYARLHYSSGPGCDLQIPITVDYTKEFAQTDFDHWGKLYQQNISEDQLLIHHRTNKNDSIDIIGNDDCDRIPMYDIEDLIYEIDMLESSEREQLLTELANRSLNWQNESEIYYE